MSRILFIKEGVSVWSSHLDLMRALMRSFRRAGIDLKHSQGFTPHPELSILMPLSVGVESQCEIAEFTLAEGCEIPASEIVARMNPVLPAGIRALDSYDGGTKAGKLAWLRARLVLEYDGEMQNAKCRMLNAECRMQDEASGIRHQASGDEGREGDSVGAHSVRPSPLAEASVAAHTGAPRDEMQNEGTGDARTSNARPYGAQDMAARNGEPVPYGAQNDRVAALRELFARPSLTVEKHSKKGDVEMDIAPMIREIHVGAAETSPACRGGGPASRPVEGCRPQHATADGIQNEGSGDEGTSDARPYGAQDAAAQDGEPVPYGAQNDRGNAVVIEAVVAAQNPTLNPLLLVTAIEKYLPEYKPEHVICRRLELYDGDMHVFR